MSTVKQAGAERCPKRWGQELRKLCAARGISQRKLSEVSGVPNQMISRAMRGAELSPWAAIAVEVALGWDCGHAPPALLELVAGGVPVAVRRELGLVAGVSDLWMSATLSDWLRVSDAVRAVLKSQLASQMQQL